MFIFKVDKIEAIATEKLPILHINSRDLSAPKQLKVDFQNTFEQKSHISYGDVDNREVIDPQMVKRELLNFKFDLIARDQKFTGSLFLLS